MNSLWIAAGVIIAVQLVSGCTIGSDQFRLSGRASAPFGRWPRLVRRADEPAYFWVLFGWQFVLITVFLLTRPTHKPQFDVQELTREYLENQQHDSVKTGK
jgi:hypothetical protein